MQWASDICRRLCREMRRGVVSFQDFFGLIPWATGRAARAAGPLGRPGSESRSADAGTGDADHGAAQLEPTLPAADPSALSTPELCRAWRISSATLRRPLCATELARTAQHRRDLLEELERRDRIAFGRWLASHRGAEDPTRFFHHPSRN